MDYRYFLLAGIIIVLVNVLRASPIKMETSTVTLNSSEMIPVKLVNCSSISGLNYQCVKIEDCKTKRRGGSRKFCKEEGSSKHVCCLQESADQIEKSSTRQKRYDLYSDEEYRPSRFNRHNFDWKYEDGSWERSWNYYRHHQDRFNHHRSYNDDSEMIDSEDSEHSFYNDEPECGVLEEEEIRHRVLAEIVGGSPVRSAASSPWMVAVGQKRKNTGPQWFCGGVLISREIVLTAAHCITKRTANLVRVGELDLTSSTESAEPQDSEIKSSVIHPDHKSPSHYHDIAILRLKTPVRYSKYVRPICLPPSDGNLYENAQVTLTGWGNVEYDGESSPILQEVQIRVISNSQCNAKYGNSVTSQSNIRSLPSGIVSSQLCAGDKNGGRDACQGDSGGPIVKKNGRRRIVVGLVSSGLGCGSQFYPGIYTRVSYYTNWIQNFL